MSGQEAYERCVRRYYAEFPPRPGDRPCPDWDRLDPEDQVKWDAMAAELYEQPAQGSLFEQEI